MNSYFNHPTLQWRGFLFVYMKGDFFEDPVHLFVCIMFLIILIFLILSLLILILCHFIVLLSYKYIEFSFSIFKYCFIIVFWLLMIKIWFYQKIYIPLQLCFGIPFNNIDMQISLFNELSISCWYLCQHIWFHQFVTPGGYSEILSDIKC